MSHEPVSAADQRPTVLRTPRWLPVTALWVGITCGVIGLIDGIAKMVHRVVVNCPNGKTWGQNETDFTCYSHPQLGTGLAIAVGSIMGALLLVLLAYVAIELSHRPGALANEAD